LYPWYNLCTLIIIRICTHIFKSGYNQFIPSAREDAADETGLPISIFPETCPFTIEQITGDDWPD